MKKLALFVLLLCCGCTNGYFQYNHAKYLPIEPKFHLRNVNVVFSEHKIKPFGDKTIESKYLTKDDVVKITKEEIVNHLKKDNMYAEDVEDRDVFECDFDVNYIRKFMLFTDTKYVGTILNGYQIRIYKNGHLVALHTDNDHIYFLNQGMVANVKKLSKVLSLNYDQQDEKSEVTALAHFLTDNLRQFGDE